MNKVDKETLFKAVSSYGKFTINTATANRTNISKLTNILDFFKKMDDFKDLKKKDMLNIPYLKKNSYETFNYLIDDGRSFTIARTKNETFYKQ